MAVPYLPGREMGEKCYLTADDTFSFVPAELDIMLDYVGGEALPAVFCDV